jgi:hypothetical protein
VTFHERAAEALGWSVRDVQSFSLPTLREMLREKHPKLAAEATEMMNGGHHITRKEAP